MDSSLVVFRDLPGIRDIEDRLMLADEGRLFGDELAQLASDVDRKSIELFGITQADTIFWSLPAGMDAGSIDDWEQHFDFLQWEWDEEPAFWSAFGLDMSDTGGESMYVTESLGRQLICALRQLHPAATLTFMQGNLSPSQIEAAAEAWGRALTAERAKR